MKKFVSVLIVVVSIMMLAAPTTVLASSNPYKDVTKRTVDNKSLAAISYVKKYNGWNGLIKKGKFYPNKYMTRHEFYVVLNNLYGSKVPASVRAACKGKKTKMNSAFVCNQLVMLAKNLGLEIKWSGNSMKMKRKDVARYIKIFATYNAKFEPKKSASKKQQEEDALIALIKKLLGL